MLVSLIIETISSFTKHVEECNAFALFKFIYADTCSDGKSSGSKNWKGRILLAATRSAMLPPTTKALMDTATPTEPKDTAAHLTMLPPTTKRSEPCTTSLQPALAAISTSRKSGRGRLRQPVDLDLATVDKVLSWTSLRNTTSKNRDATLLSFVA